jgi:ketosteroid isomerase-like protein
MPREAASGGGDAADMIERALGFVDDGDIAALTEFLDPGIEWHPPAQGTLDEVYRGYDGVRQLFSDLTDAWDNFEHSEVEFVDGGDAIVVISRLKLHAQASDMVVDEHWAYAVRLIDGRIGWVQMYTDPEQALREHGPDS